MFTFNFIYRDRKVVEEELEKFGWVKKTTWKGFGDCVHTIFINEEAEANIKVAVSEGGESGAFNYGYTHLTSLSEEVRNLMIELNYIENKEINYGK